MEQDVLNRLLYTFDEIQFIVTTHSPLVISNTTLKQGGKIILLNNTDNGYESTEYDNLYGLDYDYVLSAVMRTEPRHFKLKELKQKYIRLRSRQNNTKADKTLQDIKALNPDRFEDIKRELEQQLDEM
jgi:recF/recN/SMC N-terminal domain protein